jgi:hypothetical protein
MIDFESTGSGVLEAEGVGRFPVRYYVRSYTDKPVRLYDSYGRLAAYDPDLFARLLTQSPDRTYFLTLEDGSRVPVRLTSTAGRIRLEGMPRADRN